MPTTPTPTPGDVLDLLARHIPLCGDPVPDAPRLRALAAFSQSLLRALELVDIETRLLKLEAAQKEKTPA